MSAGWMYYHKYPPKRKCPKCGKRHYAKRIATASNGEDFWQVFCTAKPKRCGTCQMFDDDCVNCSMYRHKEQKACDHYMEKKD